MRLSRRLVNGERNVESRAPRDPKQRSDERLKIPNRWPSIHARGLGKRIAGRLHFIAIGANRREC